MATTPKQAKKTLIIASTFKQLPLADKVRTYLEDDFDITVWQTSWNIPNAPAAVINTTFMRDLTKASLQYDYGLMLGAGDNVLFEFGLFIGRMGASPCALLAPTGTPVPDHLHGVTLALFDPKDRMALLREVRTIRETFLTAPATEVNIFPSATLAATYHGSLIVPLCTAIKRDKGLTYQGKHYKSCIIKVIVPAIIKDDINTQYDKLKAAYTLTHIPFTYKHWTYNVPMAVQTNNDTLALLDFPAIISGISFTIAHLLPDDFKHSSIDYKAIHAREVDRFVITVQQLAARDFKDMLAVERK